MDVTLNDIAHHAGVGVGTAYRRFANQHEVNDALFEQRSPDVAAVAREGSEANRESMAHRPGQPEAIPSSVA